MRRSVRWLERHSAPGKGVFHSSRTAYACPGISGYLIPTLLGLGEQKLARQYATWLAAVQNEDGSWNGPSVSGKPSAFYTGQILKGLLAIHSIMPEVEEALLSGCDWLAAQVTPEGRVVKESQYKSLYLEAEKAVPESFHLHALTALEAVGRRFNNRGAYGEVVQRALAYFRQDPIWGPSRFRRIFTPTLSRRCWIWANGSGLWRSCGRSKNSSARTVRSLPGRIASGSARPAWPNMP